MANLSNINGKFVVEQTTGYVGVGTTDPNYPVEVLNASAEIALNASGGSIYRLRSDSTDSFRINKNGVGDRLVIAGNGNVGIGTDSPSAKLHIETGSDEGIRIQRTGTNANFGAIEFRNSDDSATNSRIGFNANEMRLEATNQFRFVTNSSDRMFINSSGKVGIGTVNPSRDGLNVFHTSGPYVHLTNTTTGDTANDGGYLSMVGTDFRLGNQESGGTLSLFTNNSTGNGITILSDGNVGIGTTTPQSELQVAGGIQMADDTATASATKVGTMRYRTGTEYVEVTGTDLIINGDFATDSDWAKGAGWTISGGTANAVSATSNPIYQTVSGFTAGNKYRVRFEVTAVTSGYIRVYCYVGTSGTFTNLFQSPALTTGFYEVVFEFGGTNKILRFYGGTGSNTFAGSIDNVSVLEVTEEDASYADMCMQTGSSTYEWVNIVRNTY